MACKVLLKKRKIKRGRDKIKPPRKARMLAGKISSYFNTGVLEIIPLEEYTLIRYLLVNKEDFNSQNTDSENIESQSAKIADNNPYEKQNSCYEISISSSELQRDLDKLAAEIVNSINEWREVSIS